MSNPEIQTQPLIRSASQPGGRSTRAYKVAGVTLVACVLIVGQAAITYLVLGQRSDIKSLQEQNDKLRMDLTKPRSVSVPMRMQVPMLSMLDMTETALEGDSSPKTAGKAAAPQTQCQLEAAGLKPEQVPGFRPMCDQLGKYQDQQCFADECWCVNPETGELIPGSVTKGKAFCKSTVRRFAPNVVMHQ